MTELIEKVKAAKAVLDSSQKELLTWCRDRSAAPLDKRYDVWYKYADKKRQSYIGVGTGSPLLTQLVEAWIDNRDMDRHQTVDHSWVVEGICDMYEYAKSKEKIVNVLNKHKQVLRDSKIDAILSDTVTPEGTTIPANITVDELENILKEEIMVCNFGSFEYDW